jgi:ABC-type branched-subunit amino acid transport system substrate-binding protein
MIYFITSILTTMLVIQLNWMVLECNSADIRVASFDWASYDGTTSIWDGDFTQGLSASFILAAHHFNERRQDIIPALGNLQCNHNISILTFCDTAGNPNRAVGDLLHLFQTQSPIHFITGPSGVDDLAAASILAEHYSTTPVIGSSVLSPRLANRDLYPLNVRVSPMDSDTADAVVRLVIQFGFKKLAFLHLSDGKEFAAYLSNRLGTFNVTLLTSEFSYGSVNEDDDRQSIMEAAREIKQLSLNVIICASWAAQMHLIADAAKANSLLNPENLWVFTYLERAFDEDDFTMYPQLEDLLHGSVHVTTQVSRLANPLWNKYMEKWATFQTYLPAINNVFPPHGTQDSFTCENSNFPYQLRSDFFTSNSEAGANIFWAWAYDAMLSVGFAACAANATHIAPGNALYSALVHVMFEGLSGTVKYNSLTGGRDVTTAKFQLWNYEKKQNSGGFLKQTTAGLFNPLTQQFDLNATSVVFRSGIGMKYLTQDITPPFHEKNLLPQWAKIVGYVETSVLVSISLAIIIWVQWNAKAKIVINSQAFLLQLIAAGCTVASFAIFTLTIDDTEGENMDPSAACMATPALFSVGFLLALTALAAKMHRISLIFNQKKLRLVRVTVYSAVRVVLMFIVLELIILILWISIAPLQYVRVVVISDVNQFPRSSSGTCTGADSSIGFLIASFAILFLALFWSAVVANSIKNVPTEFQETKYVALTVGSLLQVYLVAVPAAIASYSYVLGRFILLSSIIFVSVAVLLLFMFLPKILLVQFNIIMLPESSEGSSRKNPLSAAEQGSRNSKKIPSGNGVADIGNQSNPSIYSGQVVPAITSDEH